MKIGLHVVSFSWPGGPESIAPTLGGIASAAEDAGIDELRRSGGAPRLNSLRPVTPDG